MRHRIIGDLSTAAVVLVVLVSTAPAQEAIGEPIVYSVPEMADVRVERDVQFKETAGRLPMSFDMYAPAETDVDRQPVVVFVNAGGMDVRRWAAYTSWGRLVAASGMA